MINGKLALGGLSVEFGNAKKRFADLADRQKALTGRQSKLLNEEEDILGNLSRTYLPELSPEAVSSGLTELSSKMHDALETQAVHRRKLSDLLDELPEEVLDGSSWSRRRRARRNARREHSTMRARRLNSSWGRAASTPRP